MLAHIFEHVAVAYRRARQRKTETIEIALQPEVGHDRGDDAGFGQSPVLTPARGDYRENLVAIHNMPALVRNDDPIRIAVERDSNIGAHLAHLAGEFLGRG